MGYVDEVLADSPTALWEFDEPTGNLVDSVNGYTATVNGALLNQAGPKGGKAVLFDGVDDYLSIANFPDFIADGTYTYEAWVKFGSQASDYPTFVRRDGNGNAWLVRTRGPATGSRINEVETYHSGETVMTSPATFSDNAWHHVVMVSNGNIGTLYIDGVAYTNRNGSVSTGGTGTTAPLLLGCGSGPTEFFGGYMAYPAFYPTALSQARIQAHYNAVDTGPPVALLSGETISLTLDSLTGPVVVLGAVQTVPVEVLAGATGVLALGMLAGPTIATGAVVAPPKSVMTGSKGVLSFNELRSTLLLADPTPEGGTGEWFFEVLMAKKTMNALNPTASLEVSNASKRARTELKTLVRV